MDRTCRAVGVGLGAVAVVAWSGCAPPCYDDGTLQGGCPTAPGTESESTQGSSTAASTGGDTRSATDTETETDPTLGSGSGGALECPELSEVLVPSVPTIQVVVDRSASMNQNFDGPSRWEAVRDTLIDPVDGVVATFQSDIRFGVTLYTGTNATCPILDAFAPQLDALDEITAILTGTDPLSNTPTGESLTAAIAVLAADPWQGEKLIVLATDGEPDTCAVPEPATDEEVEEARNVAVEATRAAFEQGIRTFVISVGEEIAAEHLQALANAGVGAGSNESEPFYTALDQAGLVQAFNEIIAGVRSCELALDTPLAAEHASSCSVTINASEIPYDVPDGWVLEGEDAIALQGSACTAIQSGVVVIEMSCDCEGG